MSDIINGLAKAGERTMSKIKANASPIALTASGIGFIAAAVTTVPATVKAVRAVDKEAERLGVKLGKKDIVKLCWIYYITPLSLIGVSTASLIFGGSSYEKQTKRLAAAYKMSEATVLSLKEKLFEMIGESDYVEKIKEKVEKVIDEGLPTDIETAEPVAKDRQAVSERTMGKTDSLDYVELCYDPLFGRMFYAAPADIMAAQNETNRMITQECDGVASYNDFYSFLGLDEAEYGEKFGWNGRNMVDIWLDSGVTKAGKPYVIIRHYNPPKLGYDLYT